MKQTEFENRIKNVLALIESVESNIENFKTLHDTLEEKAIFEDSIGGDLYNSERKLKEAARDIRSLVDDMYYDEQLNISKFTFESKPYIG